MSSQFLRTYKTLCILVFILVALGGSVRAMNAGLACPDWPLCFGDVIPDYHPQVYFEFIHRVLAGFIGIVTGVLSVIIWKSKWASRRVKRLSVFAVVLLLVQVVMGGLTVLMGLHEEVVAAHLTLGTGFFATLLWIYYTLKFEQQPPKISVAAGSRKYSAWALIAVYCQIILGGFVASHYAALVCTDFPTCHGQWIPTLNGIIGLHVIHRLGAYALVLVLGTYAAFLLTRFSESFIRKAAYLLLGLITAQIIIGISNVLLMRPPIITVLHLAAGTAILGVAVYLNRSIYFASASKSG